MTQKEQDKLGKTLWAIADDLRGAMNADSSVIACSFYSALPLTTTKVSKELGSDYPKLAEDDSRTPLGVCMDNQEDVSEFENRCAEKCIMLSNQSIYGAYFWTRQNSKWRALVTLEEGFRYIENESLKTHFKAYSLKSIWIKK